MDRIVIGIVAWASLSGVAQIDQNAVADRKIAAAPEDSSFSSSLSSCGTSISPEGTVISASIALGAGAGGGPHVKRTTAVSGRPHEMISFSYGKIEYRIAPTVTAHAINTKGTGTDKGRIAPSMCSIQPAVPARGSIPTAFTTVDVRGTTFGVRCDVVDRGASIVSPRDASSGLPTGRATTVIVGLLLPAVQKRGESAVAPGSVSMRLLPGSPDGRTRGTAVCSAPSSVVSPFHVHVF